ncbi:hypothetical protein BPOR_0490g00040 [Botrytis porri]|uniref:Uncharacterized protein n=1 Tax=Botrytis porri TaxID=87229 RepID=A0A4Z1KRH1_9HELO|nr:hypothetical protein BPOR_0490g00040 [Botrytis porri]
MSPAKTSRNTHMTDSLIVDSSRPSIQQAPFAQHSIPRNTNAALRNSYSSPATDWINTIS